MSNNKKILIADDQEKNVKILAILCKSQGYTTLIARNGLEAVAIAREQKPDLVLMDVMMPEMDGYAATAKLKADEKTCHIPIIIVTALDSREDRLKGIKSGADDFLTKPIDIEELRLRLKNNLKNKEFHDFLENHKIILEEQVQAKTRQIREGYLDTINRLVLASEFKDEDTGSHIKRISFYTREIAETIGLGDEFADQIFHASPMHDIGKVAIPDAVLLKQGPLDDDEWNIMKTHAPVGAQILQGSASPFLKMAAEIAQSHHERWDGKGYPLGLKGEKIPLTARIMNITDQYDALRSKRPYKPAFAHDKAFKIIAEGDGRTMPGHFDPDILAAFKGCETKMEEIYETNKESDDDQS